MNQIKKIRERKKLTQAKVADLVGIAVLTYQRYESGERVPNVYTGQKMAKSLGTTVEKLFPINT